MAHDSGLLFLFDLCDEKNKFIYEVCPERYGDKLTVEELEYWMAYKIVKKASYYGVDFQCNPIEDVVESIEQKAREQKNRLKSYGKSSSKKIGTVG